MRAIYLPYALEVIARTLSYIAVLLLDIIRFLLTPFTWMQFKAHVFMTVLAGAYYVYLRFYEHHDNALLIAAAAFVVAVLSVILIKWIRKYLKRIRRPLMRIVYAPVGVCIYVRPIIHHSHRNNTCKLAKCGNLH